MGSRRYGARFGTAVANVGDLNMDGYEGKQWRYTIKIHPCIERQTKMSGCLKIRLVFKTFLFILVINQLDSQILFYNKFISCAHRQEVKTILYNLWYHHVV